MSQTEIVNLEDLVPSSHMYRKFVKLWSFNNVSHRLLKIETENNYKGYGILHLFYNDGSSDSTISLNFTTTDGPKIITPAVLNNVVLQPEIVIEYPKKIDTTNADQSVEIVDMLGNRIKSKTTMTNNSTITRPLAPLNSNTKYGININVKAIQGNVIYRTSWFYYTRNSNSLRIFKTGIVHTGNLAYDIEEVPGKIVADWMCMHDPLHQGYYTEGRIFKAVLAYNMGGDGEDPLMQNPMIERYGCRWVPAAYTGTGQNERRCGGADAVDWSIQPNAYYYNDARLPVGNTDANGIFIGENAGSTIGGGTNNIVFTGLQEDWTPDSQNNGEFAPTIDNPSGYTENASCHGWASEDIELSTYAGDSSSTIWSEII